MKNITWSDRLGHRSCKPWLLFVRGDEVIPFRGENIPCVAVVRGTSYTKDGKWSETVYRLEVADSVRAISGRDGWDTGTFAEGLRDAVNAKSPLDTWADIAGALGVSVFSAKSFLHAWKTKEAEKLDKIEQALADLRGARPNSPPPVEVVVTRHPGLIDVLREQGLVGDCEVISHASPEQVRGRHVAGVLPLALAAECASVTEVALNLPPEARGKELTADEVRQYMTGIRRYRVEVLP